MFKFLKNQYVYNIGNINIGGNIGQNPTVMIGSIFYKGDKIVKSEIHGDFNKNKAENLINKVEIISDKTGLPAMLDVVCTNSENTKKYLEFVSNTTEMPILIDAVSEESAISGIDKAVELQIIDRTIFNSINPGTKKSIYTKMKESGLQNAVILTFSTKALISSTERVELLDLMLPKIAKAGITKILVDTVVVDVLTLGLACKALYNIKRKFGFPAGCGAHNAIASWKAIHKEKLTLKIAYTSVINSFPIALGADFLLYGPISNASEIFPTISILDATFGQILIEEGKILDKKHPRYKIRRL